MILYNGARTLWTMTEASSAMLAGTQTYSPVATQPADVP
jgi:hypothetical protein